MTELEQLYRAYFSDVYLYLRRLSGDEQLAEDLTGETFLRAMRALPQYQEQGTARTWLCQIAKNLYFDHCRRRQERVPLEALTEAALADPAPGPQAAAERESETLRLHRLVHTLPDPYKEVFLLRVFGELDFKQIGAVFGKTANWACVTYHRARQRLCQKMEAQDDEK